MFTYYNYIAMSKQIQYIFLLIIYTILLMSKNKIDVEGHSAF